MVSWEFNPKEAPKLRVSNKENSNLMTKNIIKIIENKEGDINPITDLHESPVYNILFDDATERKLFRHKMIEYLSMAYGKSVQKFKKVIVTTDVSSTTIWVIVTQDYQLEVLPPPNGIMKKLINECKNF